MNQPSRIDTAWLTTRFVSPEVFHEALRLHNSENYLESNGLLDPLIDSHIVIFGHGEIPVLDAIRSMSHLGLSATRSALDSIRSGK